MTNNSDVALSSTVYDHNGIKNKVVGVMCVYPGCEGGGSFDLELCLPIDSKNALENNQEFKASLLYNVWVLI